MTRNEYHISISKKCQLVANVYPFINAYSFLYIPFQINGSLGGLFKSSNYLIHWLPTTSILVVIGNLPLAIQMWLSVRQKMFFSFIAF